jgi:hypothetical protein
MGFANAIRFILAEDQHLGWSLFAFNIGLEAGQVIVVFFLLVISLVVINNFKVNRKHWVVFLSAGVFSLALKMAIERIPFK